MHERFTMIEWSGVFFVTGLILVFFLCNLISAKRKIDKLTHRPMAAYKEFCEYEKRNRKM